MCNAIINYRYTVSLAMLYEMVGAKLGNSLGAKID
jgi:hypothetical protein